MHIAPLHLINKQLDALLEGETDQTANLANASALLYEHFSSVNWAGFYLYSQKEDELILGPFQGLPACVRIAIGKGVCGTAAQTFETQRVEDVHAFPGHIACDSASASEIVVPLVKNGVLLGVLDVDSPEQNRFSEEDQKILEEFAAVLLKHI
ncbi:GAF domain-containing protein [Sinobaca qinghaiensis]|uniref:GAF domain-containing protein n=1 Tax=Sinobaca qinghaiensis TaxID=342944 RepID=A0A419V734_9BACL|nr:GAF domain-containing protein [Sinobaca qinghaiensis]RKD75770.1 GAF domain-containing protein [Sinobaca qinghaiensis]